MVDPVHLPNNRQHLSVIGRNGSGKTQAAVWHLSLRDYDVRPWIVFNFKGDELIDSIPGTRELALSASPPDKPGIYIVRPLPEQTEELDAFLRKIWAHEKTGLYFDEGYMIGRTNKAFDALLTQGRSKEIPIIVLTQRPIGITRFVWSECTYFQLFDLVNKQDVQTVAEIFPRTDLLPRVPRFHSLYYDVNRNRTVLLQPVPDAASILATFRERIGTRRHALR